MLGFVQSWFTPASSPIGVDFGSDCLRLAQVESSETEQRLVAAASADVPAHVRNDPAARFSFFSDAVRDLLSQGNFRGRRVMLGLPAFMMHVQHVRLPKMDDEALTKAISWETRGKLPFDPTQALIRHIIAGEIYHDQEPKYEVVVIAARRDLVNRLLEAARRARVDVAGVNVEPKAMIDCFARMFRRKAESESATCFLDIGCTASRAVIAREGRIRFARVIPVGGDHLNRAVASAFQVSAEEARVLRIKLASAQPPEPSIDETTEMAPAAPRSPAEAGSGFALLSAALSAAQQREAPGQSDGVRANPSLTSDPGTIPGSETQAQPQSQPESEPRLRSCQPAEPAPPNSGQRERVDHACREPLAKLVEELSLCRRYYEATFPQQPIDRLVFVGGEAHQRGLCQQIARELGVVAQVGDPMARLAKFTEPGIEAFIDRRVPQPTWSIALGLSMGPALVEQAVGR